MKACRQETVMLELMPQYTLLIHVYYRCALINNNLCSAPI